MMYFDHIGALSLLILSLIVGVMVAMEILDNASNFILVTSNHQIKHVKHHHLASCLEPCLLDFI
jgi:NADH:ubiquinone oxidoreductase subunit K